MNATGLLAGVALCAAGLALSCNDSEDRQKNPSFSTGGTNTPAAGQGAGGEAGRGEPPSPQGGQPTGGSAGATNAGAAGVDGEGGAGAAPPLEPPYDCVLEPKTHLEIINACTDAVRVEKTPALPPIP